MDDDGERKAGPTDRSELHACAALPVLSHLTEQYATAIRCSTCTGSAATCSCPQLPPTCTEPLKQPSASSQSGEGASAMGSLSQCTRSLLTTWSQHRPQNHWQVCTRCW
jgi:hypothetical protein